MTLPRVLYRVEYLEGFGWPERTRQEHAKRTYDNANDARRMIQTIRSLPDHHTLLGVYQTKCEWVEVPLCLIGEEQEDELRA